MCEPGGFDYEVTLCLFNPSDLRRCQQNIQSGKYIYSSTCSLVWKLVTWGREDDLSRDLVPMSWGLHYGIPTAR